jgi:hypothetical protein
VRHPRWALILSVTLVDGGLTMTLSNTEIKYGLGDMVRYEDLSNFFRARYFTILSYYAGVLAIKFSLLFQYRRIFTSHTERLFIFLGIWLVVFTILTFGMSIFTCVPISKYWDDTLPGSCVSRSKLHVALATLHVVMDWMFLVIPLYFLRKLHIARNAKIILMGVFACGIL